MKTLPSQLTVNGESYISIHKTGDPIDEISIPDQLFSDEITINGETYRRVSKLRMVLDWLDNFKARMRKICDTDTNK